MFATCVVNEFLVEAGLRVDLDNTIAKIPNKDTMISLMYDDAVRVLDLTRKWTHGKKNLL